MLFEVEMFLMLRSGFYSILNFSYKLASYVSCALGCSSAWWVDVPCISRSRNETWAYTEH